MGIALFVYDMGLLVALSVATACFAFAYALWREPVELQVALYFACCIVDHAFLIALDSGVEVAGGLALAARMVDAASLAAALVLTRLVAQSLFDLRVHPVEWAFLATAVIFKLVEVARGMQPPFDSLSERCQWLYLVLVSAFCVVWLVRHRGRYADGFFRFLLLLSLMSLAGICDALGLFLGIGFLDSPWREVSNELLTVCYLVFGLLYLARTVVHQTQVVGVDETVLDALARSCSLTDREREVMALICDGKTNAQIANELWISEGTVKAHAHSIYVKTETKGREGLIARVMGD